MSPREPIRRFPGRVAGSNAQIAQELFISINTVKCHIIHILGGLGAENRTQAVVRARELGLVE